MMARLNISITLLSLLALTACASNPDNRSARRSSSYQCPAGETLVCEVTNTGRITHGSFSKKGSKCSCEDEGQVGPTVIPGIQQ